MSTGPGSGDDDEDERWVAANPEAADEITGESLLPKHVVWRSPDGSLTMRFNLSTLRKVARRACEWRAPPHFRSPLDNSLRGQIMRKFGARALYPVWEGTASTASQGIGSQIGSQGDGDERTFFERVAEFDARRLSDVHNLYACPICLLWLRTQRPIDDDETVMPPPPASAAAALAAAASGSTGTLGSVGSSRRRPSTIAISDDDDDGGEDSDDNGEEEDDEALDAAVCEPIETLYGAPLMHAWHAKTGAAPEIGAAQCCFRHQAHLTQHLKKAHCLTVRARQPSFATAFPFLVAWLLAFAARTLEL